MAQAMRMQLISCKVKNFKSVSDTGFFNFPIDNITAIIGQNESGKTSILEALETFSTGKLNPDALREDGYPEITCVFKVQKAWFDENFEDGELPRGLKSKIKDAENKISLTRSWSSPSKNEVKVNFLDMEALFTPPEPKTSPTPKDLTEKSDTDEATPVPSPSPEPEVTQLTAQEFIERVVNTLPEFQKFIDFESLLPDKIDINDIIKGNNKAEGLHGVLNLLEIMDIDVEELEQLSDRLRNNQLGKKYRSFTADFRQFWSQKIGNRDELEIQVVFQRHGKDEAELVGESYLSFWVVENGVQFSPRQRSKGLLWFLSFYLQLKACSVRSEKQNSDNETKAKRDLILLIDEPAGSLHAKAQEDVLRVFETLKKNIQVIYTTHTHHLLDLTKLYRIIAAQRETVGGDEYSLADTRLFSAHQLGALSTDTLTPIFDCMGSSFANQNVIDKTNNIIVEEVSVCYYLQAFFKLKNTSGVHLLPANGTTTVPQLARLLFGWGITYGIFVDDEDSGKKSIDKVRKEVYPGDEFEQRLNKIFRVIPGCKGIEDIFSKSDFAKIVAQIDAKDISKENSTYMKNPKKKDSKGLLAVRFFNSVEDGSVELSNLDSSTKKNIDKLIKVVNEIMAEISPPVQTVAPQQEETN